MEFEKKDKNKPKIVVIVKPRYDGDYFQNHNYNKVIKVRQDGTPRYIKCKMRFFFCSRQ